MNNFDRIIAFLRVQRAHIVLVGLGNWLAVACTGLLVFSTVLAAVFALFPWIALPFIWDATVLACAAVAAYHALHRIVFRRISLRRVALMLEAYLRRPHQWLALSLELQSDSASTSQALVARVHERTANALDEYPPSIGSVAPQRIAGVVLAALAFVLVSLFAQPRLVSYWDTPLQMAKDVDARIEPGSIAIARHAACTLRCVPRKTLFPSARLAIVALGAPQRNRYLLKPNEDGSFAFSRDSISASFAYTFMIGGNTFGPETITVVEPPYLRVLQVTLTPPTYTRRPPLQLPEGKGSIAAYAGTRANFSVASHFPLRKGWFIPERGNPVELDVDGERAHGIVPLWRSEKYSFSLMDSLSQESDSLPSFFIDILPDYPPSVRILKPRMNKELAPAQLETLWVEGVDDLGIRTLACRFRTSSGAQDSFSTWDLSPPNAVQTIVRAEAIWSLRELSLYPGDTVFYWAIVQDTKPFGPPQIVSSDTFWLRVPSFAEIHEHIAEKEAHAEQTLKAVRAYQENMKERLEEFIRTAKGKEELSWEEKKIVEDFGESLKSQVDSLAQAVSSLEHAVEQMQEQGLLSDEIIQKMNDVREAIKELIEEYGDTLLFESPRPDEAVSWQDIQKAVEKMKTLLPNLQENLENTLKYLEALRKDQELANLAARAQNLAERQLELSSNQKSDSLRQQKVLSGEIDTLAEEVGALASDSTDEHLFGSQDVPSMKQIDALRRAMAAQLAQNALPPSSQMAQMSGALQSLSQELLGMLSTAMMAQMLKDRDMLLALARDMLDLAQWQENVADDSRQGQNRPLTAAQEQALIDALKRSMQKLDSLMSVPPGLLKDIMANAEKALAAMSSALASLGGGQAPGPSGQPGAQLNSLAATLLASAEAMGKQCQGSCPSGMGSGLLPGLRKISGKQAAINSATSELLRQMLQGATREGGTSMGKSSNQASEAAQRAQEQLAGELKRLAESYGKEAGGGMEKKMKDLEEEARRLAEMLKNPAPELKDRQERFLVRLLQTTLSMHKQDEGKEERRSSSAKTIYSDRAVHESIAANRDVDSFYRIRTRALDGNFPEAYRVSVQAYFDSLGVLFLNQLETR